MKPEGAQENMRLLKTVSLVVLTLQNVSLILVMRYIRTRPGNMFFSSTAVVCAEIMKLLASCLLVFIECGYSPLKMLTFLKQSTYGDPVDCIKIAVPAVIYVLQNNLLFVAISHLDAVTYQVTYQLKLLTTALFSVIIMRKLLTKLQWLSLLALTAGVAIVQLHTVRHSKKIAVEQNPLLGLFAVIISSLMSGFAGVYFEFTLKSSDKSVWWRNLQLSFLGVLFGLITAYVHDGTRLADHGFFYGYDKFVWLNCILQSIGGLTVAMVIKYADNIIKGFSTSAAIVLACVCSIYLFDFSITPQFILGSVLVVAAIFGYGKFAASTSNKDVTTVAKPIPNNGTTSVTSNISQSSNTLTSTVSS